MHHLCRLGNCILGCMLLDNSMSLKGWNERKKVKALKLVMLLWPSGILAIVLEPAQQNHLKYLANYWYPGLVPRESGLIGLRCGCRSSLGDSNGPRSSLGWTQGQVGRLRRSTEAKTLSDLPRHTSFSTSCAAESPQPMGADMSPAAVPILRSDVTGCI